MGALFFFLSCLSAYIASVWPIRDTKYTKFLLNGLSASLCVCLTAFFSTQFTDFCVSIAVWTMRQNLHTLI